MPLKVNASRSGSDGPEKRPHPDNVKEDPCPGRVATMDACGCAHTTTFEVTGGRSVGDGDEIDVKVTGSTMLCREHGEGETINCHHEGSIEWQPAMPPKPWTIWSALKWFVIGALAGAGALWWLGG